MSRQLRFSLLLLLMLLLRSTFERKNDSFIYFNLFRPHDVHCTRFTQPKTQIYANTRVDRYVSHTLPPQMFFVCNFCVCLFFLSSFFIFMGLFGCCCNNSKDSSNFTRKPNNVSAFYYSLISFAAN